MRVDFLHNTTGSPVAEAIFWRAPEPGRYSPTRPGDILTVVGSMDLPAAEDGEAAAELAFEHANSPSDTHESRVYASWGVRSLSVGDVVRVHGERVETLVCLDAGWEPIDLGEFVVRQSPRSVLGTVLERAASAYYLVVPEHGQSLSAQQIDVLLQDDDPWTYAVFADLERWRSDRHYEAITQVLTEILTDTEYALLDTDAALMEAARQVIDERDGSDVIAALLRATGAMLLRYDLGVEVSQGGALIEAGLLSPPGVVLAASGREHQEAGGLHTSMSALAGLVGGGRAYLTWVGEPAALIHAAGPDQRSARRPGRARTPATISFSGVHLLIVHPHTARSGAVSLPGPLRLAFDPARLMTGEYLCPPAAPAGPAGGAVVSIDAVPGSPPAHPGTER